MIRDYLAIMEDNALARELEKLIGTFSRRLCVDVAKGMKNMAITDFFGTCSLE